MTTPASDLTEQQVTEWLDLCTRRPWSIDRDRALDAMESALLELRRRRARPVLPPRKEWDTERHDRGDTYESSDYVDGWNDALDAVEADRAVAPVTNGSEDGGEPGRGQSGPRAPGATQKGAATPGQGATAQGAVPGRPATSQSRTLDPTAHRVERPPSSLSLDAVLPDRCPAKQPGVASDHERSRASSNIDLVDQLVARERLDR